MDDARLGSILRTLRLRRGLTQREAGRRAGVSGSTVSRLERGGADDVTLGTIRAVCRVLEASFDGRVRWRGGDLERLLSARHTSMGAVATTRIESDDWVVRPEVSFAFGTERGIVDLVGWRADRAAFLLVELKTEIVDVGELLGTLDIKRRLAVRIASTLGWRPATVGVVLMLADSPTNRRHAARFRPLLAAALPADGRRVAAWLREPVGDLRGMLFLSDSRVARLSTELQPRRRVLLASRGLVTHGRRSADDALTVLTGRLPR